MPQQIQSLELIFNSPIPLLTTCLRKDTGSELAAILDSEHVIHVLGAPLSGKTVLARLLRDHYLENNRKVFLLEKWEPLDQFPHYDPWAQFASLLKTRYPGLHYSDFFAPGSLIIVDDSRRDGISCERIQLCMFSPYGSPLTAVEWVVGSYTPFSFGPRHRVTLTPQSDQFSDRPGLFFTKIEFVEAVTLLTAHGYEAMFTIDEKATSYLFAVTNGHSGGMRALINYVYSIHCHNLKQRRYNTITLDRLLDNLQDDHQVFGYLQSQDISRSVPTAHSLTPDIAGAETLEDAGSKLCYQNGWWIEYKINRSLMPLPSKFDKLDTLCLEILTTFSARNLKQAVIKDKNVSTAARPRSIETQYQDEFYRAFNHSVGRGVPIHSGWSRTPDARVDFYIPEKKWAIKLLREHDRASDHLSRILEEGGEERSWLKEAMIEDWIIIDCATSLATTVSSGPRLWQAVFANDYTKLKVYQQKKPSVDVSLRD
ncbi:hypothetical protein BJX99DRAFT_243644 [Aspergillus californicus]